MILKICEYKELAEKIKQEQKNVIIYGAGMIAQVIMPYIIKKYELYEYVDFFVDADRRKVGNFIQVEQYKYEVKSVDDLRTAGDGTMILITNSKFYPIVKYLDEMQELDQVEGYIIPIMQAEQLKERKPFQEECVSDQLMIPKKIHYCWFGRNEMPLFLKECIETWRKYCPDYEIIQWNEDNYDVNKYRYTKEAYDHGKYGFVTDMARLDILYENGGIYFDTDVSLIKNIDNMLFQPGFVATEQWGNINTGGGCGFVKEHPILKNMLDNRREIPFVFEDGTFNTETNGLYESKYMMKYGYMPNGKKQVIEGVTIYPSEINHPYNYMSGEISLTEFTVSVHYFYGGWMDDNDKAYRKKTQEQYNHIMKRMKS